MYVNFDKNNINNHFFELKLNSLWFACFFCSVGHVCDFNSCTMYFFEEIEKDLPTIKIYRPNLLPEKYRLQEKGAPFK